MIAVGERLITRYGGESSGSQVADYGSVNKLGAQGSIGIAMSVLHVVLVLRG